MEQPNPILVKHGVQGEISLALGCTPQYVSLALKGKRRNNIASKIRHLAIEQFNGVEVPLTTDQKNKIMRY